MALRTIVLLLLVTAFLQADARKHFRKSATQKLINLAKQVSKQQFYVEEQAREQGQSGVKVMRLRNQGTLPFYASTHCDAYTTAAIHDHPEYVNTCGMGELEVALNGIHFKTRHNDYKLVRKADVGCGYDDTVPIPYPDVPPSVKGCVEDQIEEMQNYFQAFSMQEPMLRDYRPYFKPNLCYMMGAWTKSDPDTIQEAFDSDRHHYDAPSWEKLYEGAFFESYSGTKHNLENFAFMPSRIWEVDDNGDIVYAQWNYKILCHPLEDDLPTNRLRARDDLKARMYAGLMYDEFAESRTARFQVNPQDTDTFEDGPIPFGLLDKLMAQIPGPDGYGASLVDDAFGFTVTPYDQPDDDDTPLNTAYFYRWYKNSEYGAMDGRKRHKGFNDENMWVAMTTQDNVLPVRLEYQDPVTGECQSWEQKWVYAIPLEIIYTSPLGTWNPYNITYKGPADSPEGMTIYADGRDGSEPDLAFNGTNSYDFYQTPYEFAEGEFSTDPADSTVDYVWVLNADGVPCKVRPSGMRAFFPRLPCGLKIRQRYPIFPIYGEGSPVWKELDALKWIVLKPDTYSNMLHE